MSELKVKHNDSFAVPTDFRYKENDEFKSATEVRSKINGVWQPIWSGETEFIPESQGTPGISFAYVAATNSYDVIGIAGVSRTITELKIPSVFNGLPVTRIISGAIYIDQGFINIQAIYIGKNMETMILSTDTAAITVYNKPFLSIHLPSTLHTLNIYSDQIGAVRFYPVNSGGTVYINSDVEIKQQTWTETGVTYYMTGLQLEGGTLNITKRCTSLRKLPQIKAGHLIFARRDTDFEIVDSFYSGVTNSEFITLLDIDITNKVNKVGALAFSGQNKLTKVIFRHGINDPIQLPAAGSTTGMFYYKNAYAFNVYTDSPIVAAYDFAADNVTATILPLSALEG